MEDDQLLDYEEENEGQMEADKAENGGTKDSKKAKVCMLSN